MTVAQWENGTTPIATKHHDILTHLLGVDITDL